jgi:hypothetical protein
MKSAKQKFPTDIWAIRDYAMADGSTIKALTFFETENGQAGWANANNFRLSNNASPILCPMSLQSLPWSSDDSFPTELSYLNGIWDGKFSPLGKTFTIVGQPISIDHGGDIGRQDTLPIYYYWNQDREIYLLVKGKGLVEWQHASLADGVYKYIESSVFNKFVALNPIPEPVIGFPANWLP